MKRKISLETVIIKKYVFVSCSYPTSIFLYTNSTPFAFTLTFIFAISFSSSLSHICHRLWHLVLPTSRPIVVVVLMYVVLCFISLILDIWEMQEFLYVIFHVATSCYIYVYMYTLFMYVRRYNYVCVCVCVNRVYIFVFCMTVMFSIFIFL